MNPQYKTTAFGSVIHAAIILVSPVLLGQWLSDIAGPWAAIWLFWLLAALWPLWALGLWNTAGTSKVARTAIPMLLGLLIMSPMIVHYIGIGFK